MSPEEPEQLRVATVGAANGLRGDVRLAVHTDDPESRLAVGQVLETDPAAAGPLTVAALEARRSQWYARFEGIGDRSAAEALRGVVLLAEPASGEHDAWYPHELTGLRAQDPDGVSIGEVEGIEHLPAQDALVLREIGGARTLVPFVAAIVPVVDVAAGYLVVDAPRGLLSRDEPEEDS